MNHEQNIKLWGARSGSPRSRDRRSQFSNLERDLDQQFMEEARRRANPDGRNASDASFAATDALPTPAPEPGNAPVYRPKTTQEPR